jgi:hypothetical protein
MFYCGCSSSTAISFFLFFFLFGIGAVVSHEHTLRTLFFSYNNQTVFGRAGLTLGRMKCVVLCVRQVINHLSFAFLIGFLCTNNFLFMNSLCDCCSLIADNQFDEGWVGQWATW